MKISSRFRLGKTQFELDFVDIDPNKDKRLFLDPHFIGQRNDPLSQAAAHSLQSFFGYFVELLRVGRKQHARELFDNLREPNETCLGLSRRRPRGHGVGKTFADRIFNSLASSRAVKTGVLEDLEDARIFVRGVDKDLVSDMTTNIIRNHLLIYTEQQCDLNGIPLTSGVPSGPIWDTEHREWSSYYARRLVVNNKPLLLVPKGIVSYVKQYTASRYRQHFVLNYLQHEHLRMNSALVRTRRPRRKFAAPVRYVTKKDIRADEPAMDKEYLARFTEEHPEVFRRFREDVAARLASLSDNDLTQEDLDAVVDHLIDELEATPPGGNDASRYHRLVTGILELLLYPDLIAPTKEREINEGRKRIDIVFDNAAQAGFFFQLHNVHHIPCGFVFVECKNYSRDIANPELDQMVGRFSPNRGRFGLIICRTIEDIQLFLRRCADSHRDDHGTIVPLVDTDLVSALKSIKAHVARPLHPLLAERFKEVVLA